MIRRGGGPAEFSLKILPRRRRQRDAGVQQGLAVGAHPRATGWRPVRPRRCTARRVRCPSAPPRPVGLGGVRGEGFVAEHPRGGSAADRQTGERRLHVGPGGVRDRSAAIRRCPPRGPGRSPSRRTRPPRRGRTRPDLPPAASRSTRRGKRLNRSSTTPAPPAPFCEPSRRRRGRRRRWPAPAGPGTRCRAPAPRRGRGGGRGPARPDPRRSAALRALISPGLVPGG